jgi:hypothetical protein
MMGRDVTVTSEPGKGSVFNDAAADWFGRLEPAVEGSESILIPNLPTEISLPDVHPGRGWEYQQTFAQCYRARPKVVVIVFSLCRPLLQNAHSMPPPTVQPGRVSLASDCSLNKGMIAEYSSPAHAAPPLAYNSQRSHAEPAGRAGNPVRLGMRRSSDS